MKTSTKTPTTIAGDVCTLEPLGPGITAHRYRQVRVEEPDRWGKPERTFVAWPKCQEPPAEDAPAPLHWREVSYDWAMHRGAARCPKCFP